MTDIADGNKQTISDACMSESQ